MTKKVALVTGISQGISKAIVERLVKDGFTVAFVALNKARLQQAIDELTSNGGEVLPLVADVTNREEMFAAIEKTVEHFRGLNMVVGNAGSGPTTPIDPITPKQFEEVYGVNTAGALWGIQVAHKVFREPDHGGRIINATSRAGVVGNSNLAPHSGTKSATRGITQVVAQDLATEDITVSTFAPGAVKTPMMYSTAHQVGQDAGKGDEWGMETFAKSIVMKCPSKPEDVANVISFLTGPDSNYITGQITIADGGMRFY